jgi:two-component sensor histidine kinase
MVPAVIGFVSTIALIVAVRLVLLSRSALNISGAFLLITMVFSLMGYLFQLVFHDLSSVLFWQKIQVLGINFMYPAWLIFILLLTGNRKYICWRLLVVLFVLSLFPNVVLSTPSICHWFVITNGLIPVGPYNVLDQSLGWAVLFSTIVATIQGIIGSIILFNQKKRLQSSFIPQFFFLLILPIIPFITIWAEITGNNPIAPLSLFNLSIIPVCAIITHTIFTLRVGEEYNKLKENVVNSMRSAVLILDSSECIQYANPSAYKLLNLPFNLPQKALLSSTLPELEKLVKNIKSKKKTGDLIKLGDFVFDIDVKTTVDWRGETINKMIVLSNITEREELEKTIIDHNKTITHTNELLSGLAEVNLHIQRTNNPEDMFGILDKVFTKIGVSCFITLIDQTTNELFIYYLTSKSDAIPKIEKIIGERISGYHIPEKYFPQIYNFFKGSTSEKRADLLKELFQYQDLNPVLKEAIRLMGIDQDVNMLTLQLKTSDITLGVLGMWGNQLEDHDLPTLRIFANQMASAIERHQLYQNEILRSKELERSNRLITSLVKISTQMGTSADYSSTLEILGDEIEALKLHCVLGLLDETEETIIFKYSSFSSKTLKFLTRLAGFDLVGYHLHKKYWPGKSATELGVPVWYTNPIQIFRKMFPQISESVFTRIFEKLGISIDQNLCILPLIINGVTVGVLPIWGQGIQEKDTATLLVFAHQVAEILQKTKGYEDELSRANKLSRSNAILIGLSNVASHLETTTELDDFYDSLGKELKRVNIECMIGTIDKDKKFMRMEYLSITPKIVEWAIKNNVGIVKGLTIPRRLWPTDEAITKKIPFWDEDPINNIIRMLPFIPKDIINKSFDYMGIKGKFQMCYLPLIINEEVIGILGVWGSDLCIDDLPGLTVFANQVSTSINNATLFDQAQKEIAYKTETEIRIQESLAEKEVLLKEVHHRVKNNLQIITSLLNLQINQSKDTVLIEGLRESQGRVKAMALIHEKLYQSDDLAQISMASYISSLTNALSTSYRIAPEKVEIHVDTANIRLDLDTAIPCGLIVNELITNSLKYAFPDETKGEIEVLFKEPQNGKIKLIVKDNGVGLPKEIIPEKVSSLGLKLVSSLVRQIEGEMKVTNGVGVNYEINFSSIQKK